LDIERLIESEILSYLFDDFRGGLHPGDEAGRIARDHVDHEEDEDGHAQEYRHHLDKSTQRIEKHDAIKFP
jgi:hypothetical protein